MRKINVVLMLLLVSSMTLWAERVTEEDAALVANSFMNANASSSLSGVKKASPSKRMVRKSTAPTEEAQYYVYENADGEGWVIIAADDVVRPVLAYSLTGHFRTDNMPVNIRKWMGHYNKFIRRLAADSVVAGEETKSQWRSLRKAASPQAKGNAVVGPLIKTKWDQDAPYYNLCPGTGSNKAYTGCVATAMAQVMKYWEWPVNGYGSHTYQPLNPNTGRTSTRYRSELSADFENTTYDWSNMRNTYTTFSPTAAKTAVATLMYHCGVATEMMYGNDADGGSGTYTLNYNDWTWGTPEASEVGGCAQNALWYFFRYKKETIQAFMRDGYEEDYYGRKYKIYDPWTDAEWTAMIKAELDQKRPILYGGASDEGGHSFVCDGYDDAGYFHFNWGWSGDNDGYFLLSNLNPGSGGAGGGNYNFSEDQDVLIGIEPDKSQAAGVENIETGEKAVKRIENGLLVITRGNTTYNVMGQVIQ